MKNIIRILTVFLSIILIAACNDSGKALCKRAAELCKYIPDHELSESSKDFMTADFFSVLDTMFNHMPEFEAMDHEWLYYFVTGNGGTIADYEVTGVRKTDATHAEADILVRQKWEDGSFDESSDIEEHRLDMEKVDGEWLISDFDNHKQDCIRHIEINRREQLVRRAIGDYLVKEIGGQYLKGDFCAPVLIIVATEEDGETARVWGDFWVYWYKSNEDGLKIVSGGNHPGCMTLEERDGRLTVTSFEQVKDGVGNTKSAKKIFGEHYDVFRAIQTNPEVREAVRIEQLQEW